MTRDEWEEGYAKRSGITIEALRSYGRMVRPCECGEKDCEGWQSVRVYADDDWPMDSPYPESDLRFDPKFKRKRRP